MLQGYNPGQRCKDSAFRPEEQGCNPGQRCSGFRDTTQARGEVAQASGKQNPYGAGP